MYLHQIPRANLNKTLNDFQGKGILLIRNPFKAIQSFLNFLYGGMQGTAQKDQFEGEGKFDDFFSHLLFA